METHVLELATSEEGLTVVHILREMWVNGPGPFNDLGAERQARVPVGGIEAKSQLALPVGVSPYREQERRMAMLNHETKR
jgi:hypothetical protein